MTQWKEEYCSQLPKELEAIAPNTYIQRKDIEEVYHEPVTNNEEGYFDYRCISREISFSEYNMLKSIEEIDTNKAIDDYTLQLIEEGVI